MNQNLINNDLEIAAQGSYEKYRNYSARNSFRRNSFRRGLKKIDLKNYNACLKDNQLLFEPKYSEDEQF